MRFYAEIFTKTSIFRSCNKKKRQSLLDLLNILKGFPQTIDEL